MTEVLDTRTAGGPLLLHAFRAIAAFERGLLCDRTLAGREAARARGHGSHPLTMTQAELCQARIMKDAGITITEITEITDVLGASCATVYRHLG